jgi:hypothetical protein
MVYPIAKVFATGIVSLIAIPACSATEFGSAEGTLPNRIRKWTFEKD